MLSKSWMPLDKFTKLTIENLSRGERYNTVPEVRGLWERFEKDKAEYCAENA